MSETTTTEPVYEIGGVRWGARNRLATAGAVLAQLQRYAEVIERDGLEFDPSPATLEHQYAVRIAHHPDTGDRRLVRTRGTKHARSLQRGVHGRVGRSGTGRAEVVSRWRWTLPDGTSITTAWTTRDTDEEQR